MNSCSVLGLVFMSAPFVPSQPRWGAYLTVRPGHRNLRTMLTGPVSSGALHYSVLIHRGLLVPQLSPSEGASGLVPVGRLALPRLLSRAIGSWLG